MNPEGPREGEAGDIVRNPDVRFGKPCIRGTRIAVSDVLRWLASGINEDDILASHPHLTRDGLRAALRYAGWLVDRGEDDPG